MTWQTIFSGLTALAAVVTAIAAILIGIRQTSISELQNYAEIFVQPNKNPITHEPDPSLVLVKNASSFPIYLIRFTLNGVISDLNFSAVQNNPDSWYRIPIPKSAQDSGKFTLTIEFEDYGGKEYVSVVDGVLSGQSWSVNTTKRTPK